MANTGENRGTLALDCVGESESTEKGMSSTGKYSAPWLTGHALSMGWDSGYTQREDSRLQREAVLPVAAPRLSIYLHRRQLRRNDQPQPRAGLV